MLPCWCLHYTRGGRFGQWEVFVHLKKFMVDDCSFLQEKFSRASCAPCSHHSWEDFSSIHFCLCLILRKTSEYSYVVKAPRPWCQLFFWRTLLLPCVSYNPLPLDLVLPPSLGYQLEHTFVLDKTMFAQAIATTPHLSLGGFFGMVYEHFSRYFIPEDPSLGFLELF